MSLGVASADGGGILLATNHVDATLIHCRFIGNVALSGGAIGITGMGNSNLKISNCVFTRNTAYSVGGGIYALQVSHANMSENAFILNNASATGGGAYISKGVSIVFSGCNLEGNIAGQGGGLVVSYVADLRIISNMFLCNEATAGYGSAVTASSSSGMVIHSNVLNGNTAAQAGAVYWETGDMTEPAYLSGVGDRAAIISTTRPIKTSSLYSSHMQSTHLCASPTVPTTISSSISPSD